MLWWLFLSDPAAIAEFAFEEALLADDAFRAGDYASATILIEGAREANALSRRLLDQMQ